MQMNDELIRCIVIDDEIASQKVIEHFISETEVLQLVECFSNPREAFKYIQLNSDIDLIFLDINMPEQHGLDFYKSLDEAPPVVFTTAYPQYAVDGFEVNAVDYLLKPISYERFLKAIKKVLDLKPNPQTNPSFLSLKENKTVHKIQMESIIYIEAAGDYVKVVTSHKNIMTHSTFSNFMTLLPDFFLRIHKSFCVNTNYISKLSGNQLQIDEYQLPIGQTYKSSVLKYLKL
jgi:two-component system response regulator LytT